MSALLVHCTCPDPASARHIAEVLVAEKLAACVQVLPQMLSIYRWQGQLQVDSEALLLIKTTRARFDALRACIAALHPYDLPELLALDVTDAAPAYLDWLRSETDAGQ